MAAYRLGPYKPCFYYAFWPAQQAELVLQNEDQNTVQRKYVCHYTTKTGGGLPHPFLLSLDNVGTAGITLHSTLQSQHFSLFLSAIRYKGCSILLNVDRLMSVQHNNLYSLHAC